MAKKNGTTAAAATATESTESTGVDTSGADALFASLPGELKKEGEQTRSVSSGFLYRPEECRQAPFRGFPMYLFQREDKTYGEYEQIAFLLTAPTVAIKDDKLVRVDAGDTLMVTATAAFQVLRNAAQHSKWTQEVIVRGLGQKDVGRGEPMWNYSIEAVGKPVEKASLGGGGGGLMLPADTANADLPAELQD